MNFIKNIFNTEDKFKFIRNIVILGVTIISVSIFFYESSKTKNSVTIQQSSLVTLNVNQLTSILSAENINPEILYFFDKEYSLVSKSWIRDTVSGKYEYFLKKLNIHIYKKETNDCDDFVIAFYIFSRIEYKAAVKSYNSNICVGEFVYSKTSGEVHAINIIVVLTENVPEVLFYEPQTFSFINLTDLEKRSAKFVVF